MLEIIPVLCLLTPTPTKIANWFTKGVNGVSIDGIVSINGS